MRRRRKLISRRRIEAGKRPHRPSGWGRSDHPEATEATVALVDSIEGLRGVDAGSLTQAAAIEAFTAVLITINIRHKVHTALQLSGYPEA